jgi:hypothetical protein
MCPLCIATVGVMASGAAVLLKKVRATSGNEQSREENHGAFEDRARR